MTETLYPYQQAALGPMAEGLPTYLGFDPGLGKSRTALEAAKLRKVRSLLIISPASGRYVWEQECRKWWPQMPFRMVSGPDQIPFLRGNGIVLITYGLISQKASPYAAAIAKGVAFDMTILDEAAAVKNPGANRTKAILGQMLPKLGYVVPLSGTPAPNHAGELFPILRALYPEALQTTTGKTMNQFEFENTFCRVTTKRFGSGPSIRVIEGSKNLQELRRRTFGFMRRVRKDDVLKELPPIRYDIVPVQVDGTAIPVIHTAGMSDDDLLKWLAGAGSDHVMRLRHLIGLAKLTASIEYIDDFLANLPADKKVLVFAHHKDVIESLRRGLAGWSPAVVTGASTASERTHEINSFLHDRLCRVFIGNIQAAGTGLTLVGLDCQCSDVFFVEATYSAADNVQAACRVHRIGQREAVVARFLTAHGTIDDRIQDILARKAKDFEELFK